MPTRAPKNNQFKVGDVVTGRGSGNCLSVIGNMYRVINVHDNYVTLVHLLNESEDITHAPCTILHAVDLISICNFRMQLDTIINDIVRSRTGDNITTIEKR